MTLSSTKHIDSFINALEQEYNITTVLAVAHGSRAWGLAGPNSDYDVQLVYIPNSIRHFAYLGERTDGFEREYQGPADIEVSGWDVTKFASLLADSNDQAIDTLRSPTVYQSTFDRSELRDYITSEFNPIALYHCYRGIAKNNYRKYLSDHLVDNDKTVYPIVDREDNGDYIVSNPDLGIQETISPDNDRYEETQTKQTVKRNLAVLKASMSAHYLRMTGENGEHKLPPVDFPTFIETEAPQFFTSDLIDIATTLIDKKQAGNGTEVVGDLIGRDFAHPLKQIDTDIHVKAPPADDKINEFIDTILDSTPT